MAVRTTMTDLVYRTRLLIGDPTSANQTFTDNAVQDALDRERTDVLQDNGRQLRPDWPWLTGTGGGAKEFYDYDGWGDWEADAILYDGGGNLVTATSADYLTGHWSFAVIQPAPLFVVGKSYDVFAAGYDLCLMGAGMESRSFDVGVTRGVSLARSQKQKGWLAQAAALSAQMRPRKLRLVRRDVYGAYGI